VASHEIGTAEGPDTLNRDREAVTIDRVQPSRRAEGRENWPRSWLSAAEAVVAFFLADR